MNQLPDKNVSYKVIIAYTTIYLVWGSTYFFILKALQGFPPMLLGAFRFIAAGIIMLLWCIIRGEKVFRPNEIKHAAVSGTLMLFVGTGVVIWVEQVLPSALVAILVSAAPFWFVMLDKPMWKENFSNRSTISGLVIGFFGIVLLFGEKIKNMFTGSSHSELGAMILILFGSLGWTAGSIYSKYKSTGGSNAVSVGWQMFIAGIPFAILSFVRGELQNFNWSLITGDAWLSVWYLILFGSIAAYTAYVWLLQVRPSAQVSTYAYVNPVVAVMLGVFFASEKISLIQIAGLLIILSSVLLINLSKYQKSNKHAVN